MRIRIRDFEELLKRFHKIKVYNKAIDAYMVFFRIGDDHKAIMNMSVSKVPTNNGKDIEYDDGVVRPFRWTKDGDQAGYNSRVLKEKFYFEDANKMKALATKIFVRPDVNGVSCTLELDIDNNKIHNILTITELVKKNSNEGRLDFSNMDGMDDIDWSDVEKELSKNRNNSTMDGSFYDVWIFNDSKVDDGEVKEGDYLDDFFDGLASEEDLQSDDLDLSGDENGVWEPKGGLIPEDDFIDDDIPF